MQSKNQAKVPIYKRSTSYRKMYFKHNKGIFHKWYLCAYCRHKFLEKDIVEVDHIVAVNIVKKKLTFRLLFMLLGKNVNTTLNLCAACRPCNRSKSDKGGKWIKRGAVGSLIHSFLQASSNIISDIFVKYWFVAIIVILGILLALGYFFNKIM